jgi:hypothetical protein
MSQTTLVLLILLSRIEQCCAALPIMLVVLPRLFAPSCTEGVGICVAVVQKTKIAAILSSSRLFFGVVLLRACGLLIFFIRLLLVLNHQCFG